MRTTPLIKLLLVMGLATSLSACGNANSFALLDEPGQEPTNFQAPPAPVDGPAQEETLPPPVEVADTILEKYSHLDPNHLVPDKHLEKALIYFDKNKSKIKNQNYISVIDFSKSSKLKRFFVINLKTGAVWALHTSHGQGSDSNHDSYAERFSNTSGSNASSLGIYVTAETYYGKHDLSLRLDGKSETNSNARSRAIVIHGADYVRDANVTQGRSHGCPAISEDVHKELIGKIKDGSVIYAGI